MLVDVLIIFFEEAAIVGIELVKIVIEAGSDGPGFTVARGAIENKNEFLDGIEDVEVADYAPAVVSEVAFRRHDVLNIHLIEGYLVHFLGFF